MFRRPKETVLVTDYGLKITHHGKPGHEIPFDAIIKIVMYKRDELTTDLICCGIDFEADGEPRSIYIHEELPGFDDAMTRLEQLEGFNTKWRSKFMKPPFAENMTTVFTRDKD